jgi:cell division protein FtsI/penicillin-binding protein 2
MQDHYTLMEKFGFGQQTGIDLPGESKGILPPLSEWTETSHATLGYGYSLAATPLQMAAAISSIANNGVWITPHVLKNHIQKPIIKRRVIAAKTAQTLTQLLAESLERSKHMGKLEGVAVAGKTGTSWRPREDGKGYDRNNFFTSFVGFFPVEDPKVLMLVVVDSPNISNAFGATVAAPIFKAIGDETVRQLKLKPDKIRSVMMATSASSAKTSLQSPSLPEAPAPNIP